MKNIMAMATMAICATLSLSCVDTVYAVDRESFVAALDEQTVGRTDNAGIGYWTEFEYKNTVDAERFVAMLEDQAGARATGIGYWTDLTYKNIMDRTAFIAALEEQANDKPLDAGIGYWTPEKKEYAISHTLESFIKAL